MSARDEIRAAGLVCPACGVNLADLPAGHVLDLSAGREYEDGPEPAPTARCTSADALVPLDFEAFRAASNILLVQDYWASMDAALDA